MEAAVYGTGKMASEFVGRISREHADISIAFFIETNPDKTSFYDRKVISVSELEYSDIDKLIIATGWETCEEILTILQESCGWEQNKEKVIYFRALYDPEWYEGKKVMPYISVTTKDKLTFVASSKDNVILNEMEYTKETFSRKMIDVFLELSELYYGHRQSGYFLDLGANIGTTSIYVRKSRPDLKVVAIEACKENFDLLRVNCILNQTEDIITELCGLSDQNGFAALQFEDGNCGGTCLVEGTGKEGDVHTVKLDDYVQNAGIQMERIDYIWMDVEGYEPKVIKGAWEALSSHKVAMIHEFTPNAYERMGTLEWYCDNIGNLYQYFIDVDYYMLTGIKQGRPVCEIKNLVGEMKEKGIPYTNIFLFSGQEN